MKKEPSPTSVTTKDLVIEESVPPGQGESEDAKNEAPTIEAPVDQGQGGESDIDDNENTFDNDSSDGSSYSSDSRSDSSSNSDKISVFSNIHTYSSAL